MNAAHDGDCNGPEIEVSGSVAELRTFGSSLTAINQSLEVVTSGKVEDYYPNPLKAIFLHLDSTSPDDLVTVAVKDDRLYLQSSVLGFQKLGQSVLNCFSGNVIANQHLHLDYFEGNGLIAPTTCDLILLANESSGEMAQ